MADTPDLPPLPESSWHPQPHERAFSPDQMQAYAREAVRLAARASVPADDAFKRRAWRAEAKVHAVAKWLMDNQPDVWKRGLWDAIDAAAPTPPDEATSRAQFEAWYGDARKGVHHDFERAPTSSPWSPGSYRDREVAGAWQIWQAARTQGDRA